jgi:hypothetical protein
MVDISTISAALTSFNSLKNIAQAMIGLHDTQALQAKILEFNGASIDAQTNILSVNEERATLIEHVRDLEKQVADLEAWETEKQRYELTDITNGGSFAYVLKPNAQGSEPSHQICANCYQHRKKSILQNEAGSTAHAVLARPQMYFCPECNTKIVA